MLNQYPSQRYEISRSHSAIIDTVGRILSEYSKPMFTLCQKCYWCVTLLRSAPKELIRPLCSSNEFSSFPIL